MKWNIVLGLSLLLLAASLGIWVTDGRMFFTKTAQQVVVVDPLFGTESIEWVEGLWIGLDAAGPVAAICLAVAAYAYIRTRRES